MSQPHTFEYPKLLVVLLFILALGLHLVSTSSVKYNVSTIAGGNGQISTAQTFGDGFNASMSCLAWVFHMVQTSDGSIYMSDSAFHTIRKVDGNTGLISVVAGNYYESGDDGNQTVFGPSAKLLSPMGMVINKNETWIYFVSASNCVRRIDLKYGTVSTIVGKCGVAGYLDSIDPYSVQFNLTISITLSEDENSIFISDFNNNMIRKFDFRN